MKFEAEIIKEIVDSRGHTKTSIHYQSECVEEWVREVEGAYPKLCDYQPEWLNYSAENKIGVFPYATLTDVTSATVENVVPYAYKRAILLGQTLVNILSTCINKPLTKTTHSNHIQFLKPLESGKEYTIIISLSNAVTTTTDAKELNIRGNKTDGGFSSIYDTAFKITNGIQKVKFTPTNSFVTCLVAISSSAPEDATVTMDYLMIIEGDHTNEDIPYFEGMQSVKLPVLTTTGKNLFDISQVTNFDVVNNNIIVPKNSEKKELIPLSTINPNQPIAITLKHNVTQPNGSWTPMIGVLYTDGTNVEKYFQQLPLITADNKIIDTIYIRNPWSVGVELYDVQIEQGAQATSYEPYQSIVLSTPSDLELRGIGEVKDELDCLTGQVTERIGEIVLNGSNTKWTIHNNSNENSTFFVSQRLAELSNNSGYINSTTAMCDTMALPKNVSELTKLDGFEGVCVENSFPQVVYLRIKNSKLSSVDSNGLNNYLQTNPVTIQYKLATPTIKTVDLTVIDQDGKTLEQIKPLEGTMLLETSGETIKPLFSGEIPVEAITQNLASFIEEE